MGRYPIVQTLILEWAFWHFRKMFIRKQEKMHANRYSFKNIFFRIRNCNLHMFTCNNADLK